MTTQYLSSFDYELLADALDVLDPDGSAATARKQELEAWARSMAVTGRGYLPPAADELDTLRKAISYGESFVEHWQGDEGLTRDDRRECDEAAEIVERAGAIVDALGLVQPIRVLVALEGGLVQGAVADRAGVAVTVLDYDTEGADLDRVFAIPQRSDGTSEAYIVEHDAEHDPAFIDAAQGAQLAEPEEAIEQLRERAEQWKEDHPKLAAAELARADEIAAQLAAA